MKTSAAHLLPTPSRSESVNFVAEQLSKEQAKVIQAHRISKRCNQLREFSPGASSNCRIADRNCARERTSCGRTEHHGDPLMASAARKSGAFRDRRQAG